MGLGKDRRWAMPLFSDAVLDAYYSRCVTFAAGRCVSTAAPGLQERVMDLRIARRDGTALSKTPTLPRRAAKRRYLPGIGHGKTGIVAYAKEFFSIYFADIIGTISRFAFDLRVGARAFAYASLRYLSPHRRAGGRYWRRFLAR